MDLFSENISIVRNCDKPLSLFSTISFLPKIESIRLGIFEIVKIEEFYSLNILFRPLIEHFVKFQYISMKMTSDADDSVGVDYWLFGQDREKIDYANSMRHVYKLIGIEQKYDINEILKEYGIISETKTLSQIRKRAEQFAFPNMVNYISRNLVNNNSRISTLLLSLFPRYSELSSCVHGGPESMWTYESGPGSVGEIVRMSTFASLMTRYYTYVHCYQYEKEFASLCRIAKSYLHEFVEP